MPSFKSNAWKIGLIAMLFLTLTPTAPQAQEYLIGEGDLLKIEVYGHPDLTTRSRVSGEGVIGFPLIGQVDVGTKTIPMVSNTIAAKLQNGYIVEPQVSVFILEFRSRKATIIGSVRKPGLYVLDAHTSLLELIVKSGGLTAEAGDTAVIKRNSSILSDEDIITIDVKSLIEEGNSTLDLIIRDKDNIYIAKSSQFYIIGEVKKPNAYRFRKGMNVVKAITLAGGFTGKAKRKKVKIIRMVNGKEVIKKLKLDALIQPEDVIIVSETFF